MVNTNCENVLQSINESKEQDIVDYKTYIDNSKAISKKIIDNIKEYYGNKFFRCLNDWDPNDDKYTGDNIKCMRLNGSNVGTADTEDLVDDWINEQQYPSFYCIVTTNDTNNLSKCCSGNYPTSSCSIGCNIKILDYKDKQFTNKYFQNTPDGMTQLSGRFGNVTEKSTEEMKALKKRLQKSIVIILV